MKFCCSPAAVALVFGFAFSFGAASCVNADEASQNRPQRGSSSAPATPTVTDSAKDTVVLTVWDIAVSNSPENKKADEKANLTWRLDNLPTEFASLSSVHEFVDQLKDAGRLRSLRELRLVTLDGQNATVQVGANKPEVTGSNYSSRGGRANSVTFRQIGTTIDARPRIDSEKHLQIQFEYNMSDLQKSNDVALVDEGDGKALFADMIVTRQFKTTARLKNGTAAVIRCDSNTVSSDKSAGQIELIILGGSISTPAK
jgi:Flp pilus assembly secretin CpaC